MASCKRIPAPWHELANQLCKGRRTMKRLGIIAALSAFAGNLCVVSAAQPLSEEQARSLIAPWYGLK